MSDSVKSLTTRSRLIWCLSYAIAMAYLEAAVVVYLRAIYYPEGFDFPLAIGPLNVIIIELGREAATIIMLIAVGWLCGRSRIERFAYLLLAFGVWDIFYYVWLKVQINWPASLGTWDILFLIPHPWVGPVLAPVLVSLAMIWAAGRIISRQDSGRTPQFPLWAWLGEICAGLVIIAAFLWDTRDIARGGVPEVFPWWLFWIGLLGGIALFQIALRKT